jgi:hypothetical protein
MKLGPAGAMWHVKETVGCGRSEGAGEVECKLEQAGTHAQSNMMGNGKCIYMVNASMCRKIGQAQEAEDESQWRDNLRGEDDVRGEGAVPRRAGAAAQQTR